MDLKNKRALVTGGSSGIGRRSRALLRHGIQGEITGRRSRPVEEAVEQLTPLGSVTQPLPTRR